MPRSNPVFYKTAGIERLHQAIVASKGQYLILFPGFLQHPFDFGNEINPKENSQLDFASWPLRRRTDEEIIRLCAYWITQYPCQNRRTDEKNCQLINIFLNLKQIKIFPTSSFFTRARPAIIQSGCGVHIY